MKTRGSENTRIEWPLGGLEKIGLNVAPNPAVSSITFQTNKQNPINRINLFDLEGRLVRTEFQIRNSSFELRREDLNTGIYIAEIVLENEAKVSQRIIFE